jgi:plasmid stabilization system protein ParE
MAHIIISANASNNFARIEEFYSDSKIAFKAITAIYSSLEILVALPLAGRPVKDREGMRERVIPFGNQGFIALYKYNQPTDEVVVYSIRHQREVGYRQNIATLEQ